MRQRQILCQQEISEDCLTSLLRRVGAVGHITTNYIHRGISYSINQQHSLSSKLVATNLIWMAKNKRVK